MGLSTCNQYEWQDSELKLEFLGLLLGTQIHICKSLISEPGHQHSEQSIKDQTQA